VIRAIAARADESAQRDEKALARINRRPNDLPRQDVTSNPVRARYATKAKR